MTNDSTPTQLLHQSHGSFELVVSPIVLALLGFWMDRSVFHTTPVLTVVFAVVGLVGAAIKIYYGYRAQMTAVNPTTPHTAMPVAPGAAAQPPEG